MAKNNRISWPSCKNSEDFLVAVILKGNIYTFGPWNWTEIQVFSFRCTRSLVISKQKGLLPAQRWNHQLFVYIYCFSSIYYMILCFLLSMHKPFLLEIQTGLLWVWKRQFVSPNTLHDLKPYWLLAVVHKFFLVEIELRMVNHPTPPKKQMFLGLLGSRHVQTSLENIMLFGILCFLLVSLFLFFVSLGFDSLGLVQINPD